MSKSLISFYHNLKEPVVIYDKKSETLFYNLSFEKIFAPEKDTKAAKDFSLIDRLNRKISSDIYFLNPEDYKTYNPIKAAINSKSNFTTYITYQKDEGDFYNFMITSFDFQKRYRVVYFYDITSENIKDEYEKLRAQNSEFVKTNYKAQNQAVKMALLNRFSLELKNELDIKTLITKTLKELSSILGANKSYFAQYQKTKNNFKIKYTYPDIFHPQTGETLIYKENIVSDIKEGKISILPCLKEHEEAPVPFLTPTTRIIMPILNNKTIEGIIVIFTPKKDIGELEKELLVGVSLVVSSSLNQANLFHQITKKKEELEDTLKTLKETQLQLINSEKMASLGALIASVAHEINTPLGAICANNEMMESVFSNLNIGTIDILKEMNSTDKEAIKRITNIVQSLKRFVRLDEEVQQEANINEELDLTLNLIRHRIKNGFEIEKDYGEIMFVNCYPNMLNQVFLNILMNAIHSIEEIKSNNSSYTGKIKIKTRVCGSFLSIDIFDNGKGIDKKDENKIFSAGFTTKKKGQGTGLGLAICKKIIEKHKGTIAFKSGTRDLMPDYKTVFEIKIPIV